MALRAGGFAIPLKQLPVLIDELVDRDTVADMVQRAAIADDWRTRATHAIYAPEPLETVDEGELVQGPDEPR